jgi:TRAP-type C4-dicarboxylate transport system substrate-binding protein
VKVTIPPTRRFQMKKWQPVVFLLVPLAIAAILLTGTSLRAADKPIELRLAHMFPVGAPSAQYIDAWTKKVTADSNGRLTIRIFPVNTLIPAPELYDGVAKGTADLAYGFRYLPKNYTLGVTFPFILGAPDVVTAGRVYDDVWKKFPKMMAEDWKEVKILWLSPTMVQYISTKKPVRSLEDMKGLQIRVPSKEMGDLMKDLGAAPAFMSTADFVIGMDKGTVDGGTIQPLAVEENKLGGKIKYILELSLGAVTPIMLIMNKDSFSHLPPDLQAVLDKNCESGKDGSIKLWADAYDHALKYFKAEGVEVVRLSPQERARWMPIINRARDRVGAELDGKGYPGTEIVKYMREQIEHYTR